jgi:hypothetical protein
MKVERACHRGGLVCLIALAFAPALPAQMTASLHTQQTTVLLEADEQAPRLLRIQDGKQPDWLNLASEPLIATAAIDGRMVALHWKLDRTASRVTPQRVAFVYLSLD